MSAEKFHPLVKSGGYETNAKIRSKETVGRGNLSEVRRVRVRLERDGKEKDASLVAKQYKARNETGKSPSQLVREALETYAKIKALGLPTLPTFRGDIQNGRILMTDLTEGGKKVCITTNEHEFQKTGFASEITNFDKIVEDIERCCQVSARNGITLAADAYNLVLSEKGEGEAKLYISDLELITQTPNLTPEEVNEVFVGNINHAASFLQIAIQDAFGEAHQEKYLALIDRLIESNL